MGANDGAVLAFRQLVNNGANNLRYNIVLVSDGYTQAEIPLFRSHCRGFARKLFWTAPFSSLRCTFNVFALEVSSTQSGVDDPATCADGTTGSGAMPATFFDSTMCSGGVRRGMTLDSALVRNRVAGFLPQANAILVLVNSPLGGGTQGDVAVFTTEPGWEDTALHEYGHVLGLADEYGCYACNTTDDGRTYNYFDSLFRYGPLNQPNVTPDGPRSGLKWGSMVAAATPVPTTPGSVPAGTVGMFESARYYDLGLFRPEEFCAMRTTGAPFCAVCRSTITSGLAPWTPTTTCTTPTSTPASVTLDAQIRSKFRLATGQGGYEVAIIATTNLPPTPVWRYRLGGSSSSSWKPMPATRTIQVFINDSPGSYVYNHAVDVRAAVTVAELDFWVPGTTAFTTGQATDPIALRQPDNAANRLVSDYANNGNTGGAASASLNVSKLQAGNGWLYLRTQMQYTRLAAALQLDDGYFGPEDNAGWALQSITWSPAPNQSADMTAFYDISYDANGLCWLTNDPSTVVDPDVGFAITANGKDAIGQSFSITGRLIPTNLEHRRSISTIQLAKIPHWEWPMRFETPVDSLVVLIDGVVLTLEKEVLKIDDLEIELQDARQ